MVYLAKMIDIKNEDMARNNIEIYLIINELEHIAVTFDHDPEEVYDEDPEEDYRETYGDIYPYDWYEDYLMDVHDEIDADVALRAKRN